MRKILIGLSAVVLVAAPAQAVNLGDLAKVVLGGKSVLKKAETKCGATAALTKSENRTIDVAVAALQSQLSPQVFSLTEKAATVDATTQAKDPTFCNETKKKKKGILSKIGKAGAAVLKGSMGL